MYNELDLMLPNKTDPNNNPYCAHEKKIRHRVYGNLDVRRQIEYMYVSRGRQQSYPSVNQNSSLYARRCDANLRKLLLFLSMYITRQLLQRREMLGPGEEPSLTS